MSKIKNLLSLILYAFLLNCSFGVGGGWNDLSEELEQAKTRENAKNPSSLHFRSKNTHFHEKLMNQNFLGKPPTVR